MSQKVAYYFGCGDTPGHYLFEPNGFHTDPKKAGTPWSYPLMDTTLLENGKHPDILDGRVFWTCAKGPWFAFFWWDRSGDSRPNSNSGFYVRGFEFEQIHEAFAFACEQFPKIVARQPFPLTLQNLDRIRQAPQGAAP